MIVLPDELQNAIRSVPAGDWPEAEDEARQAVLGIVQALRHSSTVKLPVCTTVEEYRSLIARLRKQSDFALDVWARWSRSGYPSTEKRRQRGSARLYHRARMLERIADMHENRLTALLRADATTPC